MFGDLLHLGDLVVQKLIAWWFLKDFMSEGFLKCLRLFFVY